MGLLLWGTVRRLATLVAGVLAVVAIACLRDARLEPAAAVFGGLAAALLTASLGPLRRAARLLREAQRSRGRALDLPRGLAPYARLPEPPAPAAASAAGVYRESARPYDGEPIERAATRYAAAALMLVAMAAALAVVAAAAR